MLIMLYFRLGPAVGTQSNVQTSDMAFFGGTVKFAEQLPTVVSVNERVPSAVPSYLSGMLKLCKPVVVVQIWVTPLAKVMPEPLTDTGVQPAAVTFTVTSSMSWFGVPNTGAGVIFVLAQSIEPAMQVVMLTTTGPEGWP